MVRKKRNHWQSSSQIRKPWFHGHETFWRGLLVILSFIGATCPKCKMPGSPCVPMLTDFPVGRQHQSYLMGTCCPCWCVRSSKLGYIYPCSRGSSLCNLFCTSFFFFFFPLAVNMCKYSDASKGQIAFDTVVLWERKLEAFIFFFFLWFIFIFSRRNVTLNSEILLFEKRNLSDLKNFISS